MQKLSSFAQSLSETEKSRRWENGKCEIKKQKFSPEQVPRAVQAPVPSQEIILLLDKSENEVPTLQMIVVLVE